MTLANVAIAAMILVVLLMLGWLIKKAYLAITLLRFAITLIKDAISLAADADAKADQARIHAMYARHNSRRLMVHELGLRELDNLPDAGGDLGAGYDKDRHFERFTREHQRDYPRHESEQRTVHSDPAGQDPSPCGPCA